jgi:hypothetical protein
MRIGSQRDLDLAQVKTYSTLRRVEIAAAEDAVNDAKANLVGAMQVAVKCILQEDLIEKQMVLIGLLRGES